MKKRSIKLLGHSTSITLEDEFWNALKKIAMEKEKAIIDLIEQIDKERLNTNSANNLSSALRIFILNYFMTINSI